MIAGSFCGGTNSVFDFNYDGKDDVLDGCPHDEGTRPFDQLVWRALVSNGNGFDEKVIDQVDIPDSRAFVVDLNGDTWGDFVQVSPTDPFTTGIGSNLTKMRYRPSLGAGKFGPAID